MGNKARKRGREVSHGEGTSEGPAKRRRQINENDAKLSKLYEELAAESDEVRLEAAKQLIMMFSPENKPQAQDVLKAMNRLMRGLCSQRKAARVGFCVTLTELLRQLLGRKDVQVEGLQLDVSAVMKMVEEKTKVEGNVPGRERRDHLIGTLFGYKAIMQSSILLEPELSLENWNKLLDNIYGMARDVPWLREECGLILVDAVKNLKSQSQPKECVQGIIDRLSLFKLANTPEGVAIWLTVRASDEKLLPEDVWHKKDPLSKKERTRLAKVLKENFHNSSEDGKDETVKSAAANPNPIFTWDLVLSEILLRDENLRAEEKDSAKSEFPQFWIDTVDSNLFAMAASHERKSWGFKLFSTMITRVPEPAISALFSPNLMRTLINQSKKEDRFLHAAALTALKAVQSRAQQDPCSALPIFTALTTKNGTVDLDRITKTKTLEQLLLAADDETLRKIVRHLNSIVLRPDSSEQNVAGSRRQVIADILLNTTRQYKRYESYEVELAGKDNWLRNILEIMVDNAYFVPSQNAKTNKVPLPPISEASRNMFRERLSSCLTKLLGVNVGSRTTFAVTIIDLIRTKSASSKSQELVFKGDDSVMNTIKEAFQTLDSISAKGSIGGSEMAAKGFTLLYALTLLQVFNEDGDAVLMLQDLDASRKEMGKAKKGATGDGSEAFIEILLTFLGNPRTLFRKIAEEAFSIFTSEVSSEGLKSLTDILDTEENLEGQRSLFDQGGDEAEEEESSGDSEEDSDVEMIDGEPESGDSKTDDSDSESSGESDSESGSSEDEEEEDDAELTQFNNLLALTLQTSKPTADGEGSDETSDESDMDDEQMMALDPHLSKIFQQRSKTTSKKKEREDAKQNVVQFKSRVVDLLAIFMDKEYSNPLVLEILLPILRRTRATANKQLAEKSSKMLKTYFDTRTKHKAPLPKPDDVEQVWEILSGIHEEASLGGGAIIHANACSNASLHVVKVLVTLDKENYGKAVDVYGETQKKWFMDKKSAIQPALFSQFQNWSVSMHRQR